MNPLSFYRQLPSSLLSPFTGRIIAMLGPLLSQTIEDTLILVLETIHCVVGEDAASASSGDAATTPINPSTYGDITRAALHVWTTKPSDYILVSVVSDLVESLASNKSRDVSCQVVQAALPTLSEAIASAARDDSSGDDGQQLPLLESAIGLAEALLKGSSPDVVTECGCVSQLCGPILAALSSSEDRDVLQNGIGALTQLVRKAPAHIEAWHDDSKRGAIDHFLGLLSRLLVVDSESGGLKVGDFVVSLLRKVPQSILPVLPALLEAMVRRLATAKTATFAQSLILPFAFLMRDQCDVVLDLLEGMRVPAAEGDELMTGLQVLASKWAENGETIQGYWAQRLSTVALTRLLSSGRASLQSTLVQGDEIPDESNLIRTRSRAKGRPQQYTSVSLGVKALKMLLADWDHASRGPPGMGGLGGSGMPGEDEADTDDDDDEWDDEPSSGSGQKTKREREDLFLSDLLDSNLDDLAAGLDDDDDGDDLQDDEVYNMDMRGYLQGFFQQLAQSPQAAVLGQGLNDGEREKLRAILEARG